MFGSRRRSGSWKTERIRCATGVLQNRGAKGAAFCLESTDVLGVREFFQSTWKANRGVWTLRTATSFWSIPFRRSAGVRTSGIAKG